MLNTFERTRQVVVLEYRGVVGLPLFDQTLTYPGTGVVCRRHSLENYDIDLIEGDRTAFFTFFAADIDSRRRLPWGASFLRAQGHTVIGIKGQGLDWFRGAELHKFLRSDEFRGFLAGFDRVVFYGGSKGGYGALAFSDLVENPIVIAISPQSTLDPRIVPWEIRFRVGMEQDWDGDFRDSVTSLKPSGDYSIFVDPYDVQDMKHIARLQAVPGANVKVYKMPFAGHDVPGALVKCKMLKDVVLACRDKTLTTEMFARLARARKTEFWYLVSVARHPKVPLSVRRLAIDRAMEIRPEDVTVRLASAYVTRDSGDHAGALAALTALEPELTGTTKSRCQKAIDAIQRYLASAAVGK